MNQAFRRNRPPYFKDYEYPTKKVIREIDFLGRVL